MKFISYKEELLVVLTDNFDTKKNELTRQGFMDLNLMEANDREGDPRDLWVTLLSMGYNKALELTEVKQSENFIVVLMYIIFCPMNVFPIHDF